MPDQPRVSACLIAIHPRRGLLLGCRAKQPHLGMWVIPGGRIRPLERMSAAAIREFKEETGLAAQIADDAHFTAYEVLDAGTGEHRICLYALASLKSERYRAGGDVTELRFVEPKDLAGFQQNLTPLCRQVLRDFGFT